MPANLIRAAAVIFIVLAFPPLAGCSRTEPAQSAASKRAVPTRDINAVLRDHDQELLAIPGVVGVAVGFCADGKTHCLKVMVVRKTPAVDQMVPKSIEGHPVEIEETGVIRPLAG